MMLDIGCSSIFLAFKNRFAGNLCVRMIKLA